jgi:nucleoside 2-deoxyribosyltransferase
VKLYLAGRYTRKHEIAGHAATLRAVGHEVTATWFEEPHGPQVQLADVTEAELCMYAARDLEEIRAADIFVLYSESDQTYNRRGGRHVEHGFALALGKNIFVVGKRENIFHYLPMTQHFESTAALLEALRPVWHVAPSTPDSDRIPSSRCVK